MARWDKRRERELGGQETQRWPGTSIVLQLGDGKGWCIGGEDPAHSGFLHIALGCWMLLTFGPRVCSAYGQTTFLLMYILGGVCGNLTSYVHTSELTVCGTGPVFALIGAWLIYQSQNKDAVDKNVSETMFRQAVAATTISFVLSSFGRIDNW
uniref:Peptidase S54 rhomboid domain-containing protein n=1 Tax=Leersia perrieri TaxID=77586 RepID=A0A0D9VFE1_9ORYZ